MTLVQLEFNLQENLKRDKAICRFGHKLRQAQNENDRMGEDIRLYVFENFKIELPEDKATYKAQKYRLFDYQNKGEAEVNELELKIGDLCKMYYDIRSTRVFYAHFENDKGETKFRPLSAWYSKHKMDFVWLFRKAQMIRNPYREYLLDAKDAHGRKVLEYYIPIHLMLSVPHANGVFMGKRFYVKEIILLFRELRKCRWWPKKIFAGEYGIEVKKSEQHGLHIHLHSFLLQDPKYSRNEVEADIQKAWRKLTGNTSQYSGIWYETLYVWQKDENNKIVLDAKGHPKKDYIKPGDPIEKYLAGVMECIKYHFKPGCLEKTMEMVLKDGRKVTEKRFDVELINEVLANTKGVRLYSRFGKFYNEPLLNSNLDKPDEDESENPTVDEEIDSDLNGSADGIEERLINPFTLEKAKLSEFSVLYGRPNSFVYYAKDHPVPNEPWKPTESMYKILPGYTIKEAMALIAKNHHPFLERIKFEVDDRGLFKKTRV